jgi:hypothetical protein
METPWQLAWVRSRLVPRWTVERLSGRHPPRVRALFVETPADEVEVVTRQVGEALGYGWSVKVEALSSVGSTGLEGAPIDLVWAPALRPSFGWDERLRLLTWLGRSLAPSGCIIVAPGESAAWGLSPCGAPGVFLGYAWAEPPLAVASELPVWSATEDGIRSEREIRELERDNVVRALERTEWKIAGRDGAAALLGIHPSTLRDRMRAFGIARRH